MSQQKLVELFKQIDTHRDASLLESEKSNQLNEIIESLEQQQVNPDAFDQYSTLSDNLSEVANEYAQEHPELSKVLTMINEILVNFR